MILVADIKRAVAQHYGISVDDLAGERRTRAFAHPRQEAMCLARRLTDQSTVSIGHRFGRDHSTVVTGSMRAEQRSQSNEDVRQMMRRVTLELARR